MVTTVGTLSATYSDCCCPRPFDPRWRTLDLVDRAEVRDAAAAWTGRVNTVTARTDRVDVDALLIRPDGCVAWALPTGQDLDATTLVRALGTWFGQPA